MHLIAQASTSAQLNWTYYFSDDGIDWYAEEGTSDSSDTVMAHGATANVHTWTPTAGSDQLKNIKYPSTAGEILRAMYTKVIFTVATASTTLYAEIIK